MAAAFAGRPRFFGAAEAVAVVAAFAGRPRFAAGLAVAVEPANFLIVAAAFFSSRAACAFTLAASWVLRVLRHLTSNAANAFANSASALAAIEASNAAIAVLACSVASAIRTSTCADLRSAFAAVSVARRAANFSFSALTLAAAETTARFAAAVARGPAALVFASAAFLSAASTRSCCLVIATAAFSTAAVAFAIAAGTTEVATVLTAGLRPRLAGAFLGLAIG